MPDDQLPEDDSWIALGHDLLTRSGLPDEPDLDALADLVARAQVLVDTADHHPPTMHIKPAHPQRLVATSEIVGWYYECIEANGEPQWTSQVFRREDHAHLRDARRHAIEMATRWARYAGGRVIDDVSGTQLWPAPTGSEAA